MEQKRKQQELTNLSLPKLCAKVLSGAAGNSLTAPEVRQQLALMGIDISGYSNPMAVLHTTLRRLKSVRCFKDGTDGQTEYLWEGDLPTLSALPVTSSTKSLYKLGNRKK